MPPPNALALAAVAYDAAIGLLPLPALGLPVLLFAAVLVFSARLAGGEPARPFLAGAIKATLAIHTAGGLWLTVFAWP